MDEIGSTGRWAGGTAADRQAIADILKQNHILSETVRQLRQGRDADSQWISEAQQQLEQLREANAHLVQATFGAQDLKSAAEEVNRRQTAFLSMLAHELRNPTAAIATATTVLEAMEIPHPRAGKFLAIVKRQVGYLIRLVDDLLDASRITNGKISYQSAPVDLHDAFDGAMESVQPYFTERQQSVHIKLPPWAVVRGDMVRLSQMFANLLGNASKFSYPNDVIVVSAQIVDLNIVISISDHGRGIAAEEQARIFDLFAQGEEAVAHTLTSGLGIGLALVKTIAGMHAGSVHVESEGAGLGSTFVVTLPLIAMGTIH